MSSISLLNPKAEFARAAQALAINISASKGLQDVMKTNLGPKGTMKMYVYARTVRWITVGRSGRMFFALNIFFLKHIDAFSND